MKETGRLQVFLEPDHTIEALVAARSEGRIEDALSCYGPDAVVVTQPGVTAIDQAGIRASLSAFADLKASFSVGARQILHGEDVALHLSSWTLRGESDAGDPFVWTGRSADVLRRHPERGWLLAIDDPWGTDLLTAGPPAL